MKLRPLHDKVLVKRTEEEETTAVGIVLPGSAAEKPSQGELIAPDVKAGDLVIFGQYGGNEVKIDGEEYLILSEGDIFGVIS